MKVAVAKAARGLTTQVISDEAGFERLCSEWDAVLDDSGQHAYFLRAQWNRLWWKHYAPAGSRLYIITCRDDAGCLIGVAPFYWRQHRFLGIPHARELLFLGMGIYLKTSEYLDIVCRPRDEPRVARAIADCLNRRRDWDRIWLHQVPATSRAIPDFVRFLGHPSLETRCDRAPYIDTSIGWSTYKRSLGRSMRRNVEYYARRLYSKHACEFRRVETLDEIDTAMDALVRLHQSRWRSKGEPGAFSDPELEAFLRQVIRHSLPQGRVRFWVLTIDGTLAAALVGFLDNGVLHYFQKGFDPSYAKEDLGTAMLGLCVRDCFNDPAVRAFDFMGGGAGYKDLWARQARETMRYEVNRPTPRAVAFATGNRVARGCVLAFRTLVPDSLRAARREALRAKRLRQSAGVARQRVWDIFFSVLGTVLYVIPSNET